jgi:predicted dehydrogenase
MANGMSAPLNVGIIGSGFISAAYLQAAKDFEQIKIISCADIVPANAAARAKEFGIRSQSVDELLEDERVDLVLNLTTPKCHIPINERALKFGKHVYSEKPLGLSVAEAEPLLAFAKQSNLRVGSAPDTFLGGGQQTARHLIDKGAIGKPIGGTAFILGPGHERWHPNPDFYYQAGGGPVFDMGPYYITALVNLLGPIERVVACGAKSFESRTVGTGSRAGQNFPVEIQTHFSSLLEFESGPVVNFNASFDVQGHSNVPIELYGTTGTLQVPDPNTFCGPVRLLTQKGDWSDAPLTHAFSDRNYRIIGVAELATSLAAGLEHRASGLLAFHVLEVMEAIVNGGLHRAPIVIQSRCERPRPLEPLPRLGDLK